MKTLQYHGGKSTGNPAGKWIAGILPWDLNSVYVEPFAGMLGVLLQRKAVKCELVNDINGDIHNWWTQVRDNHDELARLIALTPLSRREFKRAQELLNSGKGNALTRALALCVVIQQSLMHAADCPSWAPLYTPIRPSHRWTGHELAPLAERLHAVQLENRDAIEVLERVSLCPEAVVYCDPPYRTTSVEHYGEGKDGTDWARMEELLKAQQGKCAVSGYGDEWDCLGWHRLEMKKPFSVLTAKGHRQAQTRTEVLWCNFQPDTRQSRIEI